MTISSSHRHWPICALFQIFFFYSVYEAAAERVIMFLLITANLLSSIVLIHVICYFTSNVFGWIGLFLRFLN